MISLDRKDHTNISLNRAQTESLSTVCLYVLSTVLSFHYFLRSTSNYNNYERTNVVDR